MLANEGKLKKYQDRVKQLRQNTFQSNEKNILPISGRRMHADKSSTEEKRFLEKNMGKLRT